MQGYSGLHSKMSLGVFGTQPIAAGVIKEFLPPQRVELTMHFACEVF
jgi:hypothetical protein